MITRIENILRHNLLKLPLLGPWIYNQEIKRRFKVELELIKGHYRAISSHRSIIHFSINKSATQYVKRILKRCATEVGLIHIQINEYAFHTNFPYLDHLSAHELQQYQHIFRPFGYLYSAFGGLVEGIPNFQDYLVVLMIRDPRDVLTSEYFSIAYSHPPPGPQKLASFMKRRDFAQNTGIDKYVVARSEEVRQVYQRYLDFLIDKPNVYITSYEHMIFDFPSWLAALLNYCELEISSYLRQELLEAASATRLNKEDISKHKRQVIPGDHVRKLQPETVITLNAIFSNILERFGYTSVLAPIKGNYFKRRLAPL